MRPLLAGLLVLGGLLLVACGETPPTQTPVIIVVTATPLPATPVPPTPVPVPPSVTPVPPTPVPATPDRAATVAAQANATYSAAGAATQTAEVLHPPPTYTFIVAATPTPAPGLGDTITLAQWKLSVAKVTGPKSELDWSGYGNLILPDYQWWLVYVDARNQADTARNLAETIGWSLTDDKGASYQDLTQNPYDTYEANSYADNAGRDQLGVGVKAGALTHPVLIFDVRGTPAQLQIHAPGEYDVIFNLKAKKK